MANGNNKTQTKTQFKKVGDAFFEKSDQGLKAVSDPGTLSQLKSGDISAEQSASPIEENFAETAANVETSQMDVGDTDSEDTDAMNAANRIFDTTFFGEDADTGTGTQGGTQDSVAETATTAMEAQRRQRLRNQESTMNLLKQRRENLASKRVEAIEDAGSQEEKLEQEREERNIPTMMDEINNSINRVQKLRDRMTDLKAEKAEALSTSEGRKAPMGFIRGEKARIQERYNQREATITSQMQAENARVKALQGQVQLADSLAQDVVDAATFDTEMELKRIQTFQDLNQDQIDELDKDIQNEIERSRQYWQNRLTRERQEKKQVMKLMTDAPQAGITVDDTLQEATEKYQEASTGDVLSVSEAEKLGVPFGTTKSEAAEMGITPTDEDEQEGQLVSEVKSLFEQKMQSKSLEVPGTDLAQSLDSLSTLSPDSYEKEISGLSAEDYMDAAQKWISEGGVKTDLLTAFPPERYLSDTELEQLPQNLKSISGANFSFSGGIKVPESKSTSTSNK